MLLSCPIPIDSDPNINPKNILISRTLCGATNATAVAAHGDGLLVLLDVLEELDGALQLPSVDGLSGLAGVLEGNTKVGTARAGRLRRLDLLGSVSDLVGEVESQYLSCTGAAVVVGFARRKRDRQHLRFEMAIHATRRPR